LGKAFHASLGKGGIGGRDDIRDSFRGRRSTGETRESRVSLVDQYKKGMKTRGDLQN